MWQVDTMSLDQNLSCTFNENLEVLWNSQEASGLVYFIM